MKKTSLAGNHKEKKFDPFDPKQFAAEFERLRQKRRVQTELEQRRETAARLKAERVRLEKLRRSLPKPTKRTLGEIDLHHWWKAYRPKSIEEQKAACIYEAVRRHEETQKEWLENRRSVGHPEWQDFTNHSLVYLQKAWPNLDTLRQETLVEAMLSPFFIPPRGYSVFPTQKKQQEEASMQVLALPTTNDPVATQAFVEHARRFYDAGFVIVAVDKKTNRATRVAFEAVEALPPTFRKADMVTVIERELPPNLPKKVRAQAKEKLRRGDLTEQEFAQLWEQYHPHAESLTHHWATERTISIIPLYKRKRLGKAIEEKQFNFQAVCRELESKDKGCVSDFVDHRLRL